MESNYLEQLLSYIWEKHEQKTQRPVNFEGSWAWLTVMVFLEGWGTPSLVAAEGGEGDKSRVAEEMEKERRGGGGGEALLLSV